MEFIKINNQIFNLTEIAHATVRGEYIYIKVKGSEEADCVGFEGRLKADREETARKFFNEVLWERLSQIKREA